jgi:hypothetical protein
MPALNVGLSSGGYSDGSRRPAFRAGQPSVCKDSVGAYDDTNKVAGDTNTVTESLNVSRVLSSQRGRGSAGDS